MASMLASTSIAHVVPFPISLPCFNLWLSQLDEDTINDFERYVDNEEYVNAEVFSIVK